MKDIKPPRIYTDEELEAELKRRFETIENGTAKTIPLQDVFTRLEKKYNLNKSQKKKKS